MGKQKQKQNETLQQTKNVMYLKSNDLVKSIKYRNDENDENNENENNENNVNNNVEQDSDFDNDETISNSSNNSNSIIPSLTDILRKKMKRHGDIHNNNNDEDDEN